jgi:hypothetical protein
LVDPDGQPFWSAGLDCVRPGIDTNAAGLESALARPDLVSNGRVDMLRHNLREAFGDDWLAKWGVLAAAFLRQTGFNTVGNWSDWKAASSAGLPYVRPIQWSGTQSVPRIFRDMPDVYDARFSADAEHLAAALGETLDDPAMIGYFLGNEPTWGFASQTPAEGMLLNTDTCASRMEFARRLRERYHSDRELSSAWHMPVTFAAIESGRWIRPASSEAAADLEWFSTSMVERYFGTLSAACRAVDSRHLNLGARYHTVPPGWVVAGMRDFDVFSINCYSECVRTDLAELVERLGVPALVGEWHFGALDAGLPASGIGRVPDQVSRGEAYRVYLEDAAAKPWCVGVHWFTMYDQSPLGRFDGENYQIGLLDVCHRPYREICEAARRSHEVMYDVARGTQRAYAVAVTYLPRLFY